MQERKILVGLYKICYHTGKLIIKDFSLDEQQVKKAQRASAIWMINIHHFLQ